MRRLISRDEAKSHPHSIAVPSQDGQSCDVCGADLFSPWSPTNYTNLDAMGRMLAFYTNGARILPHYDAESQAGGSSMRCLTCPRAARCPGGALLLPAPGSWHSSPYSPVMHTCLNKEACRSGDPDLQRQLQMCQSAWYSTMPPGALPYTLPDGRACVMDTVATTNNSALAHRLLQEISTVTYMQLQCAAGYQGRMCATCIPGYHLTSGLECVECPGGDSTLQVGSHERSDVQSCWWPFIPTNEAKPSLAFLLLYPSLACSFAPADKLGGSIVGGQPGHCPTLSAVLLWHEA